MRYQVMGAEGNPLDAEFEIVGTAIKYWSSGGGLRRDYDAGLKLVLQRLHGAGLARQGVWLDTKSKPVQSLSLEAKTILASSDDQLSPEAAFAKIRATLPKIGRDHSAKIGGGNARKSIRIGFPAGVSEGQVVHILKGAPVNVADNDGRLPSAELEKVTAEHVWNAVEKLRAGLKDHGFSASTDYDLLTSDGLRFAPKAVFGLAATEALGFTVKPRHFSAGIGMPCFRILMDAGFSIVEKDKAAPQMSSDDEGTDVFVADLTSKEGALKLSTHYKRERDKSLRPAKLAQFRRLHKGILYCERCGSRPDDVAKKYCMEEGLDISRLPQKSIDRLIEVHHHAVQVKDMLDGHATKLDDLRCLCRNCHVLEHVQIAAQARSI